MVSTQYYSVVPMTTFPFIKRAWVRRSRRVTRYPRGVVNFEIVLKRRILPTVHS